MSYKRILPSVFAFLLPLFLVAGALPPQLYAQSIKLNPNEGVQGDTISVEISGTGTHFSPGNTSVNFAGGGITGGTLTVSSPTRLEIGDLSIAYNAKVGPRDVIVTTTTATVDEIVTVPNGFNVIQGSNTILSLIEPDWADQGIFLWDITLSGSNTNFEQDVSEISFSGSGITINSTAVANSETINANIAIDRWAETGSRTVIVTTNYEEVSCSVCFAVTPADSIISITPSSAWAGEALTLKIVVENDYNLNETSEVFFSGIEIAVNGITIDGKEITADIDISSEARGDLRDVIVVTEGEVAFGEKMFDVIHPDIDRASPNYGYPGSTLDITIFGIDTNFNDSSTVEFSGEGIYLNSTLVGGPLTIVVNITIDPDAPLGRRDIIVTTGEEVVVGEGVFSVSKPRAFSNDEEDGLCSCTAIELATEGNLRPEEIVGAILPFLLVMMLFIYLRSYLSRNN